MRQILPSLFLEAADSDERFLVLSGDHGYELFDALRSRYPDRLVNVGVSEQSMVGIAAGLCRTGFHPCIYGLAAFVPMRVLEQVKIDLCYGSLPVIVLGDGAGLTYSVLGASHQCGEDVACLRPLPNIAIYSPCDAHEFRACWIEARGGNHPSYLRIGKDHPDDIHSGPVCLIPLLADAQRVAVLEEHVSAGGLWSLVLEMLQSAGTMQPSNIEPIGLRDSFTQTAGDYQHALSEHGLADGQVANRLTQWLQGSLRTDDRG